MLKNNYVEIRRQFIHYIKMFNRNTEISPCLYNNSKVALFSYILKKFQSQFFHQKIDSNSRKGDASIKKKKKSQRKRSADVPGQEALSKQQETLFHCEDD